EVAPGVSGHGTGFALNGKIYTCDHVVHSAKKITVIFSNGKQQPAKLLREDADTDLAELQIPHPPRSLVLRRNPPHFFESVSEIGNPSDLQFVTTTGYFLTFSGVKHANIFVLDTWFGNSGSPIFDSYGQVIGMCHAIMLGTRFTLG